MRKRLTADEYFQQILDQLGQIEPSLKNPVFTDLAVGSLESLLRSYSPVLIDRVEAEAKRNPAFALLLGGVWQTQMSPEIWQRVQAVQDMTGWRDEVDPADHVPPGPCLTSNPCPRKC